MSSPRPAQERASPKTPKERKSRKRKDRRENESKNEDEVSGANGNVDGQAAINAAVSLEEDFIALGPAVDTAVSFGEDFIAFGPADESEVEPEPAERIIFRDKGKGTGS